MMIYDGVKPHACIQCNKRFTQSSDLKRHMITHTGEKAHQCVKTGRLFGLESNLNMHLKLKICSKINENENDIKAENGSELLGKYNNATQADTNIDMSSVTSTLGNFETSTSSTASMAQGSCKSHTSTASNSPDPMGHQLVDSHIQKDSYRGVTSKEIRF